MAKDTEEKEKKNHSPDKSPQPRTFLIVSLCVLLVAAVVAGGYFAFNTYKLTKESAQLQAERDDLGRSLTLANDTIGELSSRLSLTESELFEIERDLREERGRNEEFEEQLARLSGTVDTLDRLAKTDRELLQKYSRVYFLNENYRPANMTEIARRYVLPGRTPQFFLTGAYPFLLKMLEDAERNRIDLRVLSAFRSFEEQSFLKGQFTRTYGSGANAFSADQGYSEHQLGTTVDIVDTATAATSLSFANTEAYKWLTDNAHRYGFVLSYPPNNEFYIFEPWHWRFVGRDLARYLNANDLSFYDLDQREIDTYLVSFFD